MDGGGARGARRATRTSACIAGVPAARAWPGHVAPPTCRMCTPHPLSRLPACAAVRASSVRGSTRAYKVRKRSPVNTRVPCKRPRPAPPTWSQAPGTRCAPRRRPERRRPPPCAASTRRRCRSLENPPLPNYVLTTGLVGLATVCLTRRAAGLRGATRGGAGRRWPAMAAGKALRTIKTACARPCAGDARPTSRKDHNGNYAPDTQNDGGGKI